MAVIRPFQIELVVEYSAVFGGDGENVWTRWWRLS